MKNINFLSLVIPAYKQEKTIKENLNRVENALKQLPMDYELIVVVDGYVDKTFQIAKRISKKNKKIRVYGYKNNKGKGFSVKLGVTKAKGDVIGFIDAGMDLDPSGISILLDYMKLHNADIVVGSKLHSDSKVNYPLFRKILSFFYRWLNQFLFGLSVLDTQVGMKIFKRRVAKDVFPKILVKKYGFDVEVLALAYALGYKKIYEAPIRLNFRPGSISWANFFKISFLMALDSFAVYYRLKVIKYYDRISK